MTTMLKIKKFEKGLWFTSRMSPQNCKFLFRFKKSKSPTKSGGPHCGYQQCQQYQQQSAGGSKAGCTLHCLY